MSVIIIVNVVISLTMILGGFCMRENSDAYESCSIGFKTKRALSSEDAWYFANQRCGIFWIIFGILGFLITMVSLFLTTSERNGIVMQSVVLGLQILAFIFSIAGVEKQLKNKYDKQ